MCHLSTDQLKQAVNHFSLFIQLTDINQQIVTNYDDLTNYQLLYFQMDGKNKPNEFKQIIKRIKAKAIIDYYLMALVAIIVVREQEAPGKRLTKAILNEVAAEAIPTGGSDKNDYQFPQILKKIKSYLNKVPQGAPQAFIIKQNEETVEAIISGSKDLLGVDPASYAQQQLAQYYEVIITHPKIKFTDDEMKSLTEVSDQTIEEPPSVADISYRNAEEYDQLTGQLNLRLNYLNHMVRLKSGELVNSISKLLIEKPEVEETFSLPETSCYKSQLELMGLAESREPICAIKLDLYIDYIIDQITPKDETRRSAPHDAMLMPLEQSEDIQAILGKSLAIKQSIRTLHEKIGDWKQEIEQINLDLKQLQTRVIFPPSKRILKKTINHDDYEYDLEPDVEGIKMIKFGDCDLSNLVPEQFDETLINVTDEEITRVITELCQKCEIPTSLLETLQHIGEMKDKHQENFDHIKYATDSKNHVMSQIISDFAWAEENKQYINNQNSALRYYLYWLHMIILTFKQTGKWEFISDPKSLENVKEKTFTNYQQLISNENLDRIIAISTVDDKQFDPIVDQFAEEDKQEVSHLNGETVARILRYCLYNELLFNYNKLKLSISKQGYCTFVKTFLSMIISHNKINDTTTKEVENLRILIRNRKTFIQTEIVR